MSREPRGVRMNVAPEAIAAILANNPEAIQIEGDGQPLSPGELVDMLGLGEEMERFGWVFGEHGWQPPKEAP